MVGYDFDYPNARLDAFCKNNKLSCFDSLPYFKEYMDEQSLESPYFSFEGDGHYASLGHEVMTRYLLENVFKLVAPD